MTTSPREILDVLGRDTLVRLIHDRGLPTSRENDDRRSTLSRSYRGDVEQLILELTRAELVEVFRTLWFEINGEKLELRNPSKYRLEELQAFAIRAFARRPVRIVADFDPYEDDDEDEDYDEEEADDENDDEGGDEPRFFRRLTSDWSRPRMVSRILRKLGWDVPERLRATRFQELIAELKQHGIEACLADDPDQWVLNDRAESPGIAAKLRLRRPDAEVDEDDEASEVDDNEGDASTDAEKIAELGIRRDDDLMYYIKGGDVWAVPRRGPGEPKGKATKVAVAGIEMDYSRYLYFLDADGDIARKARASKDTRHARRRSEPAPEPTSSRARDTGPPITIQAGERPITQRTSRPPDYQLAMLRLQFITAVPSVERRSMPEWPDGFVGAAVKGLNLRPQELALLRTYSASLCFGQHSPYDAIPQLTQALNSGEWKALLLDFAALNPFQPDFVNAIVSQIQPVQAPRSDADTWRDAVPAPPDLVDQEPEERQETLAAAPKRAPEPAGNNVRDLGALAGMFEEE